MISQISAAVLQSMSIQEIAAAWVPSVIKWSAGCMQTSGGFCLGCPLISKAACSSFFLLNIRFTAFKTTSDSTEYCEKTTCIPAAFPCRFFQELQSKGLLGTRWHYSIYVGFLGELTWCGVPMKQKAKERGWEVFNLILTEGSEMIYPFPYLTNSLSEQLIVAVPQAVWLTVVSYLNGRIAQGVNSCFWNFTMCCCMLKQGQRAVPVAWGGKMRFLMQLSARGSLSHNSEQIPEACYYMGNRALLQIPRALNSVVKGKDEKEIVGKLKQWELFWSLKIVLLGFWQLKERPKTEGALHSQACWNLGRNSLFALTLGRHCMYVCLDGVSQRAGLEQQALQNHHITSKGKWRTRCEVFGRDRWLSWMSYRCP